MRESVSLYGFGSFFVPQSSTPRDIDILIVHQRADPASIGFAIQCKAAIKRLVCNVHVVMLSESEEQELAFLQKCEGKLLGRVNERDPRGQLELICRLILEARSPAIGRR